jgi:hypothetical protein
MRNESLEKNSHLIFNEFLAQKVAEHLDRDNENYDDYYEDNSQEEDETILSLQTRKRLVIKAVEKYGLSVRKACKIFNISRSGFYYEPKKSNNGAENRLVELTRQFPQYGYWKLYYMLRDEGFIINHKRVYRIYKRIREAPPIIEDYNAVVA